jgi:hypothetical protein
MTFEEAILQPGDKVQAWDISIKDNQRAVSIYAVGAEGARQLAYRDVLESSRGLYTAELSQKGLPPAETDFNCGFVWVPHSGGLTVYDKKSCLLDARGDRLTVGGRDLARADITVVFTMAADDYVERGVKAELRSGEKIDLAVELALGPMSDPTYSRNELLFETGWCAAIASALAGWAGIGWQNRI